MCYLPIAELTADLRMLQRNSRNCFNCSPFLGAIFKCVAVCSQSETRVFFAQRLSRCVRFLSERERE